MSCISKSKLLSLEISMRSKVVSYLQVLANASTKNSISLINRIDDLILKRENYKKLCSSNNKPTIEEATSWLQMWNAMFQSLESELQKETSRSNQLNVQTKKLLDENIALLIEKEALAEDTIIDLDIKNKVRVFLTEISLATGVLASDLEALLSSELSIPEMSLAIYQKHLQEHQDKTTLDPISGYLILDGFGAFLGEIKLKEKETFEDFLRVNPYYQSLINSGAILTIGPNIHNMIGEECVYCVNYEEMYKQGLLRNSEEDNLPRN